MTCDACLGCGAACVWTTVYVSELTEVHVCRQVRIPQADGAVITGQLTGIFPFAEAAQLLRVVSAIGEAGVHLVHNCVQVQVR